MRVKKHGDWHILELSKYEIQILLDQQKDLQAMIDGEITGIVIGGANIEIQLPEGGKCQNQPKKKLKRKKTDYND